MKKQSKKPDTEEILPIQTLPSLSSANAESADTPESDDDDDDESPAVRRAYKKKPRFLDSGLALEEDLTPVNPEKPDEPRLLIRFPSNYDPETHRIAGKDFADDTLFLDYKANRDEKLAEELLKGAKEYRERAESLRSIGDPEQRAKASQAMKQAANIRRLLEGFGAQGKEIPKALADALKGLKLG